jgi:sulfhydrogenase subunit beta (sulfur reductase)
MSDRDKNKSRWVIQKKSLQNLFDILAEKGYLLYGPVIKDGAIVIEEISKTEELPIGWIDIQDGGSYRLNKHDKPTFFGYVVGFESWKKLLYPPEKKLFELSRAKSGFEAKIDKVQAVKRAFIGVRSCELAAIAIQDKILMQGPYVNDAYKRNREESFIVAVNCTRAGGTCFCVSMKTGPEAHSGFDLLLTEVIEGDNHYFVVESGSEKGAEVLNNLDKRQAGETEIRAARKAIDGAVSQMGRSLDTDGIKELLYRNLENPRWDEVAKRCLTCGNCTMVCQTCFCYTMEDTANLTGRQAIRLSKWDSCFTIDFSYIHGGSIRSSVRSRYRQWMTHKLASWQDQFDVLGCVGCGRCITWCPAGIDITEEARAIRESELTVKQN